MLRAVLDLLRWRFFHVPVQFMHRYVQQFGRSGFRNRIFGQGAKAKMSEALRFFAW